MNEIDRVVWDRLRTRTKWSTRTAEYTAADYNRVNNKNYKNPVSVTKQELRNFELKNNSKELGLVKITPRELETTIQSRIQTAPSSIGDDKKPSPRVEETENSISFTPKP